ncbi:kinase-like protein [Macrolepiota fuliginosa MF-IS2]|uniref:Kinase-like protein n=1 Tax=Macrolepiota fuliginosa MF-IS2 TaxID=1400762 RepID=A0A9P5XH58_9AGAR|nr:kinase-like protein [Macrolepiota fuliginosa MF-IS2]
MLCSITKSARVYPRCYTLKNLKISDAQPLAGGGFADIYKVSYKKEIMCVKVFRLFKKEDQTQALVDSVKEMLLWANASHDNVLPFYGIYRDEAAGRPCLVSPWMENGNLHEYLKRHPDAPRALLVQDVAEGLHYLHQASIVHGDLKAQNILVSDDGRALIADFGLSTVAMTTRRASPNTVAGCTTRFTALEIVLNKDGRVKPTKASDIWSFGCLCLEAFTGKTPYYRCRTDVQVVMALQKEEKPDQPRDGDDICGTLEGWISDMMKGCWATDPKERPSCEKIRNTLVTNGNQPDVRPKTPIRAKDKPVFRRDMEDQLGMEPDYRRVEELIRDVSAEPSSFAPMQLMRTARAVIVSW